LYLLFTNNPKLINIISENEIEIYVIANHRMISDSYHTYAMDRNEVTNLIKAQIDDNESDNNTGLACACRQSVAPVGGNSVKYDYESIFCNKLSSLDSKTFIIENVSYGRTSSDYTQYPEDGVYNGFFNTHFPEGSNFRITRLRTILTPEDMIHDVTFVPDPAGDEPLSLHIFIEEYNPWDLSSLGIPLLFLFPTIFSKKIRRRYWKHSLLILVTLYLFGI